MDRLFRTYESFAKGNTAAEILRDRVEKAKVYFEAVAPFQAVDIEGAVSAFLTGAAPGHNPAFAPSAPQVGAETRRQMNLRLDSEARHQRPKLPAPEINRSPESIARVQALVRGLADRQRTDDARREPRPRAEGSAEQDMADLD